MIRKATAEDFADILEIINAAALAGKEVKFA